METINITYNAIPNKLKGQGFLPVYTLNGKQYGHAYAGKGYEQEIALELAKQAANDEVSHYTGDWTITIAQQT